MYTGRNDSISYFVSLKSETSKQGRIYGVQGATAPGPPTSRGPHQ